MKQEDIRSIVPRKYKATTDSKHSLPVAPNLLKRDFDVKEPNKVWVADTTYVSTLEKWLYLAAVMDLGCRRIKGWAMSNRLTKELALDSLSAIILKQMESSITQIEAANIPAMNTRSS